MASKSSSASYIVNTAKVVAAKTQVIAKYKILEQKLTTISKLASAATQYWDCDIGDDLYASVKTYLKNVQTKQDTLATNLENYLGTVVKAAQAAETLTTLNAELFK